ncbi:MAG TPA: MobF family relaxase [Conexibacter sp.]|nr:MobF family relaxase [Conexibacter sp.]
MLTLRKFSVHVGNAAAAGGVAAYVLEPADAPQAYARANDGGGDGAPARANVMWLGSDGALAAFGVARGAEVTREHLEIAVQGQHVESGSQVRKPGRIKRAVAGADGGPRSDRLGNPVVDVVDGVANLDMTFSAPKSVSVVWSQAEQEQRAEIEQAIVVAANAAFEHMTMTKGVVRPRVNGERGFAPAHGMAVAAALHATARRAADEPAPAPQLHVHGLLIGVEDAAGALRAPDPWAMFKHDAALEGGAVGRAMLAHELVGLGYAVEPDTGRRARFFELRGVPAELVEAMSGRAREVERGAREAEARRGQPLIGGAIGMMAAETRLAKDAKHSPEQVAEAWDALARGLDFGPAQAAALRREPGYAAALSERRREARDAIMAKVAEQGPTVSVGSARAIAWEAAAGRLDPHEAHELLEAMEQDGTLVALTHERVTTSAVRGLEEHVLAVAAQAGVRRGAALSEEARARGIAEARTTGIAGAREAGIAATRTAHGSRELLGPEQLRALSTLTGGEAWSILTGHAGTGMDATLAAFARACAAGGWQLIACASDGRAARRLGQQLGAPFHTIKVLARRVRDGQLQLDERTVVVVEEAGRVGLALWAELAGLHELHGARVLAVGHETRAEAAARPGLLARMLRMPQIPVAELTEPQGRAGHADLSAVQPWLGRYQAALDRGRASEAVELLHAEGALTLYDDRDSALQGLVADWDRWRHAFGPGEAVMIVQGSGADLDRVNMLAQAQRLATGDIAGEGVSAVDRDYLLHAGDVVALCVGPYSVRHDGDGPRPPRVENGSVGVVAAVDAEADRVQVRFDEPGRDPRLVSIDQAAWRARREAGERRVPALRLAYASGTLPAQGATVRAAVVLVGREVDDRSSTYVGEARGIERHSVHAARENLGAEGGDEQRRLRYAERIAASRSRSAPARAAADELDPSVRISFKRRDTEPVPRLPWRAE